jgi:hypothetical protein
MEPREFVIIRALRRAADICENEANLPYDDNGKLWPRWECAIKIATEEHRLRHMLLSEEISRHAPLARDHYCDSAQLKAAVCREVADKIAREYEAGQEQG